LIVFIAFLLLLLFIVRRLVSDGCCICGPLALVPPDIQQLFSNGCSPLEARRDIGISTLN
jgi:hypothetical protein